MRFRHVIAIVVAVFAFSAFTVGGQEEPLPLVTPHVETPLIALAVEPILLETPKPTLASAAHANDFATFDALYRDAQRRGENVAAYATLHDVWTYSVTDPVGAFYGPALHDRLARAYPGYAAFIEDHRIVDSRGSVFYPSSETRAFLLARAEAGVVVTPAPVSPVRVAHATRTRRHHVVAAKPAPIAPPVVITPAPAPAPALAAKPAPLPTPVVRVQQKSGADRGLLLVIVGLIGIGLLALILRAPREEMPSVITPAPPPENHQ